MTKQKEEIQDYKILEEGSIDDDIYDAISSSNYYFYWSKKVGGRSYKDPNTDMWVRVGVYDFIYAEQ